MVTNSNQTKEMTTKNNIFCHLPDLPVGIVCTAVVADNVLSVGRATGGTGRGLTVEVVVKSQHSLSGNSLQRTNCKAPNMANHRVRQHEDEDKIFKFFILKRVMMLMMPPPQTTLTIRMT